MPYQLRAAEILAEWRAAERRLLAAQNSADRQLIHAEIMKWRDAYQARVDEASAASQPNRPQFPERA